MAGLGIGIAWFGYAVLYYGVTQVQGGNWGLLDLMVPSRWATAAATPTDGGGSLQKPADNADNAGTTNTVTQGGVQNLNGVGPANDIIGSKKATGSVSALGNIIKELAGFG